MTLGILLIVFTHMARISIENYWAFLLSGYFVWNFVSQGLTAATFAPIFYSVRLVPKSLMQSREDARCFAGPAAART